MSHLPEALERMAEQDPSVRRIRRIPVGTMVLYHGRSGSMRQGRTEFPAMVLKQHEDDGSLDMIVFFEAEDVIWEQRVLPTTESQPGHSWELVGPADSDAEWTHDDDIDELRTVIQSLREQMLENIDALTRQMYGDYNPPKKSMIEYLDDFDARLKKLEKSMRS